MARPPNSSKMTPRIIAKICDALAIGATYKSAAQYAGISECTFHNWMKKGRKARYGRFHDFVQDVEEAKGRAKIGALASIAKAAKDGDWKAAKWLLERREPEGYADHNRVKIDARFSDDQRVNISVERAEQVIGQLPDEALALLESLAEEDEEEIEGETLH